LPSASEALFSTPITAKPTDIISDIPLPVWVSNEFDDLDGELETGDADLSLDSYHYSPSFLDSTSATAPPAPVPQTICAPSIPLPFTSSTRSGSNSSDQLRFTSSVSTTSPFAAPFASQNSFSVFPQTQPANSSKLFSQPQQATQTSSLLKTRTQAQTLVTKQSDARPGFLHHLFL
jgi:hypothetical protein